MRILAVATIALIAALTSIASARAAASDKQIRNAETLETIAHDKFGTLTEAERRLVRGAPARELSWGGPDAEPNNPANDPAQGEKWKPERTIRAEVLSWLCADPEVVPYVHPSGLGIAAARITGTLDLSHSKVAKPLALLQCYIPNGIDISHAQLESLDLSNSATGPIEAELSAVKGDVALRYGTYGTASFFRSRIDGNLDCSGGRFLNRGHASISAIEATIAGDVLFHDGFETDGFIDLRLARIGHALSLNNVRFIGTAENGLNAERATVEGTLYWVDIQHTARTQLDLENAKVDALWDDQKSWPNIGNLVVDGLVYNHFSGGPSDVESRLRWLGRQPAGYRPQPYRQLAKVLRDEGQENGSAAVLIASQNAQRRFGSLGPMERLWNLLLEATVGYGYRPLRALWWIIAFVMLGTVLFGWGYRARLVTPIDEGAYHSFVAKGIAPPHYPPFNAFVYSLENFLPVVELHQGEYWRPNPQHAFKGSLRFTRGEVDLGTMPAGLLRWYLWIHIIAGWTLTPLLFAGLSGLIRVD